MMQVLNVLRNLLKPRFAPIMLAKTIRRLEIDKSIEATRWAESQAKDSTDFFCKIDESIWKESILQANKIKEDSKSILKHIPYDLGGGGAYPILYFLTRKFHPRVIVESGVAAGWSSRAFLSAISENPLGQLYSSDFPYFRLDSPEKYIGILVPDRLRKHWTLNIRGDSHALREFVAKVSEINLFHYDSDKSYAGRKRAWEIVCNKLNDDSIVIYDDIQNNLHFKELVEDLNVDFMIFKFEEKYLGMFCKTPFWLNSNNHI